MGSVDRLRFVFAAAAAVVSTWPSPAVTAPRPAVPADPLSVILDAARSRPLIALSEGQHWNEQGHRFRLALIREPRFAETFDDVVVEFGSARHQDVIDLFIAGEDVPFEQVRLAWQDTTQPNEVWDLPIYEEFFRAVRVVNTGRQPAKRLRVLLADPPIDWAAVTGKDDILRWMDQRGRHAAELIRTQVLTKKRRALMIFGDGHHFRHPAQPNVVSLLTAADPAVLFNIATPTSADLTHVQPDIARWPAPSIALLKGTVLGAAPFGPFYDVRLGADVPAAMRQQAWESRRMEEQFDALLYLGPPNTITLAPFSPARCQETAYMAMRTRRMALVPWGQSQIDRLKSVCAAANGF